MFAEVVPERDGSVKQVAVRSVVGVSNRPSCQAGDRAEPCRTGPNVK